MIQRDYIRRLIAQLSEVLAALMGYKSEGRAEEGRGRVEQAFKEMLDMDMGELEKVSEHQILSYLKDQKQWDEQQINATAELLYCYAEMLHIEEEYPKSQALYKKALPLYVYLQNQGKVFSLDRMNKIDKIQNLLA
ncbi:MAG: hypothetical protein HC880_18120 [Bacteroidia bacterium]|nr:hypothetical protein [Bacteroidia bacterium]